MSDDLRARQGFASQSFMQTLGVEVADAGKGWVTTVFRKAQGLTQQHGFLHAGVSTAIADSSCGYSALSMAPEGADVLTIEFKSNFLRPASGDVFEARAKVVKPGSKIMVCECEVWETQPGERLVMTMTATMFIMAREDD
ncbi:MAG: PaaI family thioesterase [Pseudomonadota bacterium]|nr:PaaI family thioesterase [Pseudomonadota bacterium]